MTSCSKKEVPSAKLVTPLHVLPPPLRYKSVTNIHYTGITFINNLYNKLNSEAVTKVLETE